MTPALAGGVSAAPVLVLLTLSSAETPELEYKRAALLSIIVLDSQKASSVSLSGCSETIPVNTLARKPVPYLQFYPMPY